MTDETIDFSGGNKIALIVRGKNGPDHHPSKLEQHADTIEGDGSPIGFFGKGNDAYGNSVGLRMDGDVYEYPQFQTNRPFYVGLDSAVANRVVSTVLIIDVDAETARKFKTSWDGMKASPGSFSLLGNNCATHASKAFRAAGVVDSGIPWMDTPDNLYDQLVDKVPAGKRRSVSGYIGFTARGAGGYNLVVRPAVTANVNVPNPGSSGSLSTNSSSSN
jgi:hypothetical protein